MTAVFVFDLDNTLINLQNEDVVRFPMDYSYHIKPNPVLYQLIDRIPFPKFIFSNASHSHVMYSLNALSFDSHSLIKKMSDIYSYTNIKVYKPDPMAYHLVQERIAHILRSREFKVFFFDDLPDNLVTAKKFNWTTILIGKQMTYNPFIDYIFPTIEDALFYFNQMLHK
jgi:FMN phosphatase YigB (HAD superfamily)